MLMEVEVAITELRAPAIVSVQNVAATPSAHCATATAATLSTAVLSLDDAEAEAVPVPVPSEDVQ